MRVVLAAPADNDRSPRYMEKALAAIHQALEVGSQIRLHYATHDDQLSLMIDFDDRQRDAVVGPLLANYPKARIESVESHRLTAATHRRQIELTLTPDLFPILRHSQFEDMLTHNYADPIDSLLNSLRPDGHVRCELTLTVTRADAERAHRAKEALSLLEREFFKKHKRLAQRFLHRCTAERVGWIERLLARLASRSPEPTRGTPLDVSSGYRHEREADLQAAADKLGGHLFAVSLHVAVESDEDEPGRKRLQAAIGALGAFTRSRLATFTVQRAPSGTRKSFLLSHEELATLWHPPTVGVDASRMHSANFVEREAPARLPSGKDEGEVVLGQTFYRDDVRTFGLRRDDRRRHVHIVGRTGVGKTTLLLNQLHSDIVRGHGVALIDPHGDLADSLLQRIPTQRTNDVVLFDAADPDYAVAFNPLACNDASRIDQVTSGAVAAFKKLHDSWGPRLENLLRNAVFAVVERGGTLITLLQLLTDAAFRERFVPGIRDGIVRAFWEQEFAGWSRQYRTEAVAALTNKVQPFLTNTSVRAIVSQSGRSLDLRWIMDEGKILIANLSKGKVGEDNSSLLGAFLVTAIQQAAMTRADVPESERRDFYLAIDEFQNFVTTSFETILSEARKYRLNLTVSHQYLAQLNEATAAAIAGNIGTIVSFAVGSDDAEWLARAINSSAGQLQPADLTNLPKYTAYIRMLLDGLTTPPFSMRTLAPPPVSDDRRMIVTQSSRRQFSRPLAAVRQQVNRELFAGRASDLPL
ncbi:MAG: type IV secretion system DNA-binding domain-containing protein [Pirellulales bacterium]